MSVLSDTGYHKRWESENAIFPDRRFCVRIRDMGFTKKEGYFVTDRYKYQIDNWCMETFGYNAIHSNLLEGIGLIGVYVFDSVKDVLVFKMKWC